MTKRRGEVVGAVDFGAHQVRVVIARRDDDGAINVLGHGAAPVRGGVSQGVIQDLQAAKVALKAALGEAEKLARVRVKSLFCGVNGRNVETYIREGNVKLDEDTVEYHHMQEALDIASRELLVPGKNLLHSTTSQEWYVDDLRVIDPAGIRGNVLKTRVHFACLPSVIEDNLRAVVESQQEREVEDIVFLPLAAALGCLTPEDMQLGVAVLDIGYRTTGLAVYRERRILGTHCFEWGGNHITGDVSAVLHVSFDEAEELIQEYGISDALIAKLTESEDAADFEESLEAGGGEASAPIKLRTAVRGKPTTVDKCELDQIIFERCHELMIKVRQHLHAKGLMKNLVRGVVLTGGGGAIKNQAELAEAVFEVTARVGHPNEISGIPAEINRPEYSSVLGVVRHGFNYRAALENGRAHRPGISVLLKNVRHFFARYVF